MKRMLLVGAALAALGAGSAHAQTAPVIDPVHMCNVGVTMCGTFNGVTPDLGGPFGVTVDPSPQTGLLEFAVLIPTNDVEKTFPTITGEFDTKSVGFKNLFTFQGVYGPSSDLDAITGGKTAPPNPISAYGAASLALDPGFVGSYDVYTIQVVGNVTQPAVTGKNPAPAIPGLVVITGKGHVPPLDNSFSFGGGTFTTNGVTGTFNGLPNGTIITSFLDEIGVTIGGKHEEGGWVSTAQSSALVVGGTNIGGVPEPKTWVEMALGFALLGGIGFRRKQRSAAFA
jgi:hypothetical protein